MSISKVNFIGIGAQKAGTSWLFKQFEKSSQIDLPPIKELHYFDRSTSYLSPTFLAEDKLYKRLLAPKWTFKALRSFYNEKNQKNWLKKWYFSDYSDDWYLSLFDDLDKCKGEITPAYAILKEEDVARMAKLVGPDTKIIYLLRHPVERAWSSYKYYYLQKGEDIDDYEHAKSFIHSNYQVPRSEYLNTLKLYRKYFKSVFIGFFDAIIERPEQLLVDVFEYLELETAEIKGFKGLDKKINTSKKIVMPEDVQDLLEKMYNRDIYELANTYGEYFKVWDNPKKYHALTHNFKTSIVI